jgi:KipI family sensor histidine kinase inhibitor
MTVEEAVTAHTGTQFSVAFCGFSPGFAYLAGLPARLAVPRRASPRTRVPAGSVALADGWCGVYPQASPGGWALVGTTDVELFDLDRDPPALLTPGTRVRFVRVDA